MSKDFQKAQSASNKAVRIGTMLLLAIIVTGTIGYMLIEDMSFINGLYMTIITISTVGFKEVGSHALSDFGKIFTILIILISLGALAYIGSSAIRFIIDGELKYYLKTYKVDKKIHHLKNHVIIVGYGRNGEQAAIELKEHHVDFVIIDRHDNVIACAKEDPDLLYIKGEATQEEILDKAGIRHARAIIITLPNDADNVFVALSVRNLNKKIVIISRASEIRSIKKLRLAGVDNVIMPEIIGGTQMAKLVHQPDVVEFLDYVLLQKSQDVQLVEISCKEMSDSFVGKSIGTLGVREHSGANIIGIKSAGMKYFFNPDSTTILTRDHKLFVLGNPKQIENLQKWMKYKKS